MSDTPDAAPINDAATASEKPSQPAEEALMSTARRTFLAWERLRILYIVVLGLLTLLLAGPNITRGPTLVTIIMGAIVANTCFFAGPIVETYVCRLGFSGKWLRWAMFVSGTLLAAVLAIATLAHKLLPVQL